MGEGKGWHTSWWIALGAFMLAAAVQIGSSVWPDKIKPHPRWFIAFCALGVLLVVIPATRAFVIFVLHRMRNRQGQPEVRDSIRAKFVRARIISRELYDDVTRQAMTLLKFEWPATVRDLICEIHLVNSDSQPITIQRIEAEIQLKDGTKISMTASDLDLYQIAFDTERKVANSPLREIFERREDLSSLWQKINGVELRRGIGYQGWVAFEFMAKQEDLSEPGNFTITLVDSLEGRHPVLRLDSPNQDFRIVYKKH